MMSTSEQSVPELTSQDIQSYEKKTSFNLNSKVSGMQVLDSGLIALFTFDGVKILKITEENKFEVVKELPEYKDMGEKVSIQDDDGCLIFSSGIYKDNFKVLDNDFNLVQEGGMGSIATLCKLAGNKFSRPTTGCSQFSRRPTASMTITLATLRPEATSPVKFTSRSRTSSLTATSTSPFRSSIWARGSACKPSRARTRTPSRP